MPPRKAEIDKNTRYSTYPVWKITELIKLISPNEKGLSTMNKGFKLNILTKLIKEKKIDESEPIFEYVKPTQEREYGMKGKEIKAYTDKEQKNFIQTEILNEPLKQKKLDPVKHKIAYNKNLVINIQKHQEDFVVSFLNDNLQGALLFHSVGSGKTLTAVIFSHYYLTLKPDHNVVIISPPTLLFNFVEALKQYGLDIKDNRYKFETYEKFSRKPNKYVNEKSLLIIDEAHNFRALITEKHNKNGRIITEACEKCDKVLAMTGTPFVNKPYDIENIMAMISKRGNTQLSEKAFNNLIEQPDMLSDYFDYRISYFNIMDTDSKKYFPDVSTLYVPITMDDEKYIDLAKGVIQGQIKSNDVLERGDEWSFKDNIIKLLQTTVLNEETNEMEEVDKNSNQLKSFYSSARQLSNFIAKKKFEYILKKIQDNPNFKTIIYSVFMTNCLSLLKRILAQNNIKYVDIDGSVDTRKRQTNLNQYNDPLSGVNILLISRAGTEGVSTIGTRQIFICESQFNPASSEQAIARAIRFRSHMHLPENERHVQVYRLMLCLDDNDVAICDALTKTDLTAVGIYIEKIRNDRNLLFKNIVAALLRKIEKKENKINLTLETAFEPYKEQEILEQRKKQNNKIVQEQKMLDEQYVEKLIKYEKITDTGIIKKIQKLNKLTDIISNSSKGGIEGLNLQISNSPDIILERLSLVKKFTIDSLITRMYKNTDSLGRGNVKLIEEYDDETTQSLKKALKSGKDAKEIIQEQRQILNTRVKKYLSFASKINDMFLESKLDKIEGVSGKKQGEALQEFYTPEIIADELVSYSKILTKTEDLRILEPTAGSGNLVSSIVRARNLANMNNAYTIEMIEFNPFSWEVLKILASKHKGALILQEQKDFLSYVSNEQYDLIVMNPPFHLKKKFSNLKADMWDGDFVARAYSLLKPGGEMLVIATNRMRDMNHNTLIKAKRKGLKKSKGFDLSNFEYPPDDNVEILKEYKNFKWNPENDLGGESLILNFTMYRITK